MKGSKRVMVTSDYHIPYMDEKAYACMKAYAKKEKPHIFVLNGDILDFYAISRYDKNPEHYNINQELDIAREKLIDLRKTLGDKCEIYYLEGNHECRLQKYLWKNPELISLKELKMENLLNLNELNIKWVGADPDYWKKSSGSLNLGNTRIMHGDNALNGAKTSGYSGYSAKNTVQTIRKNVVLGHVHRGAVVYNTNEDDTLVGVEAGCLCQNVPTANWQQGFATFEVYKGKGYDYRFHHILDGKLYEKVR